VQADSVKINATDSKTIKLETKYKKEIIGITLSNRKLIASRLAPDMAKYIKEKIFR
jgi:hypothetical protein